MTTNYKRGADFERKVAKDLEKYGYVTIRSAGSHSPADIVAMGHGRAVCVQCKRDGRLDPDEWNAFFDWCGMANATPVMAGMGTRVTGIIYRRLTSRKDGRGRQPWVRWAPQSEGNLDGLSQSY